MQNKKTARGAFAALAAGAALAGSSGSVQAAPLALEPAPVNSAPVAEEYTSSGSSTISSSVNAKVACLFLVGSSAC